MTSELLSSFSLTPKIAAPTVAGSCSRWPLKRRGLCLLAILDHIITLKLSLERDRNHHYGLTKETLHAKHPVLL
jgi:hypothetical protein